MEVYSQAELLGRAEGLTEEDLLILRTTALLKDTGYLFDYHSAVERSAEFARNELPRFGYSEEQVRQVADLLLASPASSSQPSLLEKIMYDAETLYYGRIDFIALAENQYQELYRHGKVSGKTDWKKQQILLLESHAYYTPTARRLCEISKEEQIRLLERVV